MSQGPMMSIFICKSCKHKDESDVSTFALPYNICPNCGERNGEEQNTHLDKNGWDTPPLPKSV